MRGNLAPNRGWAPGGSNDEYQWRPHDGPTDAAHDLWAKYTGTRADDLDFFGKRDGERRVDDERLLVL